ncbi:hypothetical protein CLOSYM_00215 [[Clostridium] symbiosum ATCC 14940]|uniref:Uncharacterized protein n=1 Tax=[Clostridium] symbiosum ATCC 14940 TaxID=411472 RepID=A0ABC9U3K5_CLOSY|nr:hypothetical protein CLOSYM_00215 [[Clostridium] symbiosum ATCC 14940]
MFKVTEQGFRHFYHGCLLSKPVLNYISCIIVTQITVCRKPLYYTVITVNYWLKNI